MSDYKELLAELRSKWLFPRNIEAADLIERLIRERDEARAKAIDEAAKIVIDAAAIADHPSVYMGGPTRHAKWVAQLFADAILALREKP